MKCIKNKQIIIFIIIFIIIGLIYVINKKKEFEDVVSFRNNGNNGNNGNNDGNAATNKYSNTCNDSQYLKNYEELKNISPDPYNLTEIPICKNLTVCNPENEYISKLPLKPDIQNYNLIAKYVSDLECTPVTICNEIDNQNSNSESLNFNKGKYRSKESNMGNTEILGSDVECTNFSEPIFCDNGKINSYVSKLPTYLQEKNEFVSDIEYSEFTDLNNCNI